MAKNTNPNNNGSFSNLGAEIQEAAAELGRAARAEPELIRKYRDSSVEIVNEQRKASLDKSIREPVKGAIIPVELLRFKRKQDREGRVTYEPRPISVDDVLISPEPTLWLGNFGQGKSTAAIELTEKLNDNKDYVAVFLTAKDINKKIFNELGQEKPKENDEKVLKVLSGGVTSLQATLRRYYKFVFVIDALDEVLNYRVNVIHALKDRGQLSEYGKVIVTSRFTGLDPYENPGFTTLHLDPQAVIRNMDKYLELRILDETKRQKFKDFVMQQDEGVRTTYLLVYFLTEMYNKRPQDLGDLKGTISEGEVLIKGIEIAIWEGKLPKRPDLPQIPKPYDGQPPDEASDLMERYEAVRGTYLEPWMNLLQRIASYMTTHDKRIITRAEIEQIVSSDWTLAKYASELKGR